MKCEHVYKWDGDFCQWTRDTNGLPQKVIQWISYCKNCGDIQESPVAGLVEGKKKRK